MKTLFFLQRNTKYGSMRLAQEYLKYDVPRTFLYREYKILKKNSQSKQMQYHKKTIPTASTRNIFRKSKLTIYETKSFLKGTIFLLLLSPKCLLACYGGTYYEWHQPLEVQKPGVLGQDLETSDEASEHLNMSKIKNPLDRNLKSAWDGWTPPPDVVNDWKLWLHNYQLINNGSDFHDHEKDGPNDDPERGPGSNWPAHWLGSIIIFCIYMNSYLVITSYLLIIF